MTWRAMSGSGAAIGTVPTLLRLCRIPGARWLGTPRMLVGAGRGCCVAGRSTAARTSSAPPSAAGYDPAYRDDNIGFRLVSSRLRP